MWRVFDAFLSSGWPRPSGLLAEGPLMVWPILLDVSPLIVFWYICIQIFIRKQQIRLIRCTLTPQTDGPPSVHWGILLDSFYWILNVFQYELKSFWLKEQNPCWFLGSFLHLVVKMFTSPRFLWPVHHPGPERIHTDKRGIQSLSCSDEANRNFLCLHPAAAAAIFSPFWSFAQCFVRVPVLIVLFIFLLIPRFVTGKAKQTAVAKGKEAQNKQHLWVTAFDACWGKGKTMLWSTQRRNYTTTLFLLHPVA